MIDGVKFALLRIADLRAKADQRASGYVDEFLAAGQSDGEYLVMPRASYEVLRAKHEPPPPIIRAGDARAVQSTSFDGSALWAAMHAATAPSPQLIQFVTTSIPCGRCKADWLAMLNRTPPVFSPLTSWRAWVTDRHSETNIRLGRRPWSYAESDARWPLP